MPIRGSPGERGFPDSKVHTALGDLARIQTDSFDLSGAQNHISNKPPRTSTAAGWLHLAKQVSSVLLSPSVACLDIAPWVPPLTGIYYLLRELFILWTISITRRSSSDQAKVLSPPIKIDLPKDQWFPYSQILKYLWWTGVGEIISYQKVKCKHSPVISTSWGCFFRHLTQERLNHERLHLQAKRVSNSHVWLLMPILFYMRVWKRIAECYSVFSNMEKATGVRRIEPLVERGLCEHLHKCWPVQISEPFCSVREELSSRVACESPGLISH